MKRSLLGKILERQQKLRPPLALGEWKHISASAAESTAEAAASASAADEATQNQNSQDADAYEFDERSQDSLDAAENSHDSHDAAEHSHDSHDAARSSWSNCLSESNTLATNAASSRNPAQEYTLPLARPNMNHV